MIKLSSPATRQFWEMPVLYEDDHLLALNKPALLLTSPDRADPQRPSLTKLLHSAIAQSKPWAKERALSYLMNAHRLDFETSGVLLFAKSKAVLIALANLFGSGKPVRTYAALVHGSPRDDQFAVDAKLASHPSRPGEVRMDQKKGKRCRTELAVRERFSNLTLLNCKTVTGRPHQIRVHLKHAGFPIVGDALYGGKPLLLSQLKSEYRLKPGRTENPLIDRVALHAEELSLVHPVTGAELVITALWAKDLTVAVKYLRRYAAEG